MVRRLETDEARDRVVPANDAADAGTGIQPHDKGGELLAAPDAALYCCVLRQRHEGLEQDR
jgi:hypothetical protein